MATRLELQSVLETILGSKNVYYQAPKNVSMKYPAILYNLNHLENAFADDGVYKQERGYSITVIDYVPDSKIAAAISMLPRCKFDRAYPADGLNHTVFNLYF